VDLTVSPEPHLFPLSLPLLLLLFLLRARGCLGKNRGFEVTMGDSGRLTICYSLLALWDCSSLNLGLNLGLVFGLGSELELTCRTFGLDMDHGNSKPDLTCRGMGLALALYTGHDPWSQWLETALWMLRRIGLGLPDYDSDLQPRHETDV
jgi:hypothetical protein